jgi:hypothetical protein
MDWDIGKPPTAVWPTRTLLEAGMVLGIIHNHRATIRVAAKCSRQSVLVKLAPA